MSPATFIELLTSMAEADPNRIVYSHVFEHKEHEETLTIGALHTRAKAIAAKLQEALTPGDRALVICNPKLQCITAFFGCLYGGFVAVPVPPIKIGGDPRIRAIADDAGATIALGALERQASSLLTSSKAPIRNVDVSNLTDSHGESWIAPELTGDSLAFLQYTSGSTGTPKGVMVSHKNLLSNAAHMHQSFGLTPGDRSVLWLPLYHDMGLMGGVIQSIYSGYHTIFLSPSGFINHPLRWLELISEYRATVSGAPNFAYDLCARVGSRASSLPLDLSSWRVAFNGSEMVRAETLRRFAETFQPYGFQSSSFRPCYGLAEATLLVSSAGPSSESLLFVDAEAWRHGRLRIAPSERTNTRSLVSVGRPVMGHSVIIVEPDCMERCDENQVGEIWVSGPSVAAGYWRRPDETQAYFRACLTSTETGPYLRTGDLGFIRENDLFVTGRLKDLIIARGRNYYPQDIEATVESSHHALRRGCGAAFSVELNEQEQLVVVQEVTRQGLKEDLGEVMRSIRDRVCEEHELSPYAVVLIRTGTILKTSSGKIRRRACRDAYVDGRLNVLAASRLDSIQEVAAGLTVPSDHSNSHLAALGASDLEKALAKYLGHTAEELDPQTRISALGLDSLIALELKMAVQKATCEPIPISLLLGGMTVADLRNWIESRASKGGSVTERRAVLGGPAPAEFPLSTGQRALWFLYLLEPDNSSLTISRLLRIRGPLHRDALRMAFNALLERHASLRIRIRERDGEPYQEVCINAEICIEEHDARSVGESDIKVQLQEQARRPFDLANGPVLRLQLYVRSDTDAMLLLCVHHIAVDLWSLHLLAEELSQLYDDFRAGRETKLPHASSRYSDYVEWQSALLTSEEGRRLWNHWRNRLEGPLPVLDLSIGRQGVANGIAGAHRFRLSTPLVRRLKYIAQRTQATLHAVLLAAFEALLYRYTGQQEFLLGVLSTGRTESSWNDVVGYFANPLILRPRVHGSATFERNLRNSRNELLEAIDYSDFPFATVVERLHPGRSGRRAPLIQVMCMLHPSIPGVGGDFASFALGFDGGSIRVGDLKFESLDSDFDAAQFELVLTAAESGESVQAAFRYDTGRFDADAIAGLAADYATFLEGVAADPGQPVDWLPLLSSERTHEVLLAWNATTLPDVAEICIHEAIEIQASSTPENIAVIFESTQLSYAELNARANQLAHYLTVLGVGPESMVGILLERSHEMVIAILGVLKAGGAYVPLDPVYPTARTAAVLGTSQIRLVLTTEILSQRFRGNPETRMLCLDLEAKEIAAASTDAVRSVVRPDNLAYVMHTSGSTGQPKGVMISHRNVANFFRGMDEAIGCSQEDTLLAVTSIAFDISVLEILWTLARGCRVVLARNQSSAPAVHRQGRAPDARNRLSFSLFYFASADSESDPNRYRLLLEGAKLADQLGFDAVWTPERHFHPFGGLYPNPSVTSAALATITERIHLRAGSVVLPLQNPIRIAEEWALVDNLSNGRTGIAFASGWHADDFVFFPENYDLRRQVMLQGVETVRRLWRGEAIRAKGGAGREIEISTYPRPVQAELPVWLTSAGSVETFVSAANIRANVLTHLLGQDVRDVRERINAYRAALEASGADPGGGTVTLMLHTYLDETMEKAHAKSLGPFKQYLNSSVGLVSTLLRSLNLDLDIEKMTEKDRDDLLTHAAERYMTSSGLFGTERICLEMLEALASFGINEIACLVDFGIDAESALRSIRRIHEAQEHLNRASRIGMGQSLAEQALRHGVTMMQCTPSLLRMLTDDQPMRKAIGFMRVLMLGGEPVPSSMVKDVAQTGVRQIFNMYGPTETTIWSASLKLDPSEGTVFVGAPIANTRIYILGKDLTPMPPGVTGEIYLGGSGLARGYLKDPVQTAERFLPDPFSRAPGERLYRTGDLGRLQKDGRIELVGRADQQVKICGHRIELGDIEASLNLAPGVRMGVAVKQTGEDDDERLVAFLVPTDRLTLDTRSVSKYLRSRLPHHMIPSIFHVVEALPLTANGKIDRRALLAPTLPECAPEPNATVSGTDLESKIAAVWKEVLQVKTLSLDDNFFDIGGHSLLMVRVHHKVQRLLGRDFPLVTMLEHPTIRSVARHLADGQDTPSESGLDRALKQRSALLPRRERAFAARERN